MLDRSTLELALNSARLLCAGRLFRDNRSVLRRLLLGSCTGAAATILVGLVAPFWLACLAGGAVAGVLQPVLFRRLRYA